MLSSTLAIINVFHKIWDNNEFFDLSGHLEKSHILETIKGNGLFFRVKNHQRMELTFLQISFPLNAQANRHSNSGNSRPQKADPLVDGDLHDKQVPQQRKNNIAPQQ